jgi:hypothetical protein
MCFLTAGLMMFPLAAACSQTPNTRANPGPPLETSSPGHGPSPGALRTAWQIHTPYARQGAAIDLIDGRVLVVATLQEGVVGRDPRTGRVQWRHREPGMEMTTYGATGGTVVVRSQSPTPTAKPGPEDPHPWPVRLVGLDAAGRQLWRRDELAVQAISPFRVMAGGGTIATWQRDGRRCDLAGADARTGQLRWTAKVEVDESCNPGWASVNRDTDGSLFLATDRADRLHAIDPATGRSLWERKLPRALDKQPEAMVRQGVALLFRRFESTGLQLVDSSGRELYEVRGGDPCRRACGLAVLGDRVALSHVDADGQPRLTIADRKEGKPVTMPAPGAYATLIPAAAGVYGLRLWPAPGLDVIDLAARRIRQGPLPPGIRMQGDNWREDGVTWLAVSGGRLFVADGGLDGRTAITSAIPR